MLVIIYILGPAKTQRKRKGTSERRRGIKEM